jgi:hypothetical protein
VSKFVLKIFIPEDNKYIEVDDIALSAHGVGDVSKLTEDEKQLYELMRNTDIDMAHIAFTDDDRAKLAAQSSAFIFGTFYINLAAFKK